MQKKLFQSLRTVLGTGVLLGALVMPAAAAQDISVNVDDRAVQFTDARPLIRDNRTYMPFRAIFEQMGASVAWDGSQQTITATRGDRNVRFRIGQANVAVIEDGKTNTIDTDAAPFVEDGRTYVPVRFASQSLGACVDWVTETRTVLIVDAAKLAETYQGQFTKIDQYIDFAGKGAAQSLSGYFAMDAKYSADMGAIPIRVKGTVNGTKSSQAIQLSGEAQTDVDAMREAVIKNEGSGAVDHEIETLLSTLSSANGQVIISRTDGNVYFAHAFATELGAARDGWISAPFAAVAGESAISVSKAVAEGSFADYLSGAAQSLSLKGAPTQTVSTVRTFLEKATQTYGDQAFVQKGTSQVLEGKTGTDSFVLQLDQNASGEVVNALFSERSSIGEISLSQTADTYQLKLTANAEKMKDMTLTVNLKVLEGGAAPMVRPSGEVVQIKQ